jgi:hypothetical protein
MEGRHPETDVYRNNVGRGDYRRCRVSLIFQAVTSMFFSAIAMPTGGMPEGWASSRMLWALREQLVNAMRCLLELNRHPHGNMKIRDPKVCFD